MPAYTEIRQRRAAENQSLFREVNERVVDLNERFEQVADYGSWTCECSRLDCGDHVDVTTAEYEAVPAHPERFVVAPSSDHIDPSVERIVDWTDRYWIVEMVGEGAERAEQLDPRSA